MAIIRRKLRADRGNQTLQDALYYHSEQIKRKEKEVKTNVANIIETFTNDFSTDGNS